MKKQTKAYIYALATVGLWSTVASASKITLSYITPTQFLFFSSLVSLFVLFIIVLFQGKIRQLQLFTRRDVYLSIGFGFLNPFAYYLVLFKAYDMLPAQQAQIINYTWALSLTLLSIPFLKQQVTGGQWLAILTSYAGVLVIATKGRVFSLELDDPIGIGYALFSTIIWALYWVLNTKDSRDPVLGLFLNFFFAIPMVFIYLWVTEGFSFIPVQGFWGAAYVGVFEMGVAFVLWLNAMKLTDSTAKIANLIFISPIISLFLIHYLVGEEIYTSTLIGLVLVLAGLGLRAFGK
ncbi:MAG: drug/metabolite transporter (DMT)-like permease [Desulforhopalus sp.]|jgi:drug/metabolite transporter (DMT)-like permease